MKELFHALAKDRSEVCQPTEPDDYFRMFELVNGARRSDSWTPISVKIVRRDGQGLFEYSDCPWIMSSLLVFRSSVTERLGDLLRTNGELLPLECGDEDLTIYNPRVIDCLCEEKSKMTSISDGTVVRIEEHYFEEDLLDGVDLFKIPNLKVSPVVISRTFVDAWRESGLVGLDFLRIWPSDP